MGYLANVVKNKTVINYPVGNGFNSTYKHVDDWGMVYDCFKHIIFCYVENDDFYRWIYRFTYQK